MSKVVSLIIRYVLIILAGLGGLIIFYKSFYPLTFILSSYILSMFGEVNSFYTVRLILFNGVSIELINACIAGSAYYLLFILALSVPDLKIVKRISILLFSFTLLLLLNVSRIVLMGLIAKTIYFESVHMLFWYIVSIIFVVGIWFFSVKLFSIKKIPVYSDIIYLVENTKTFKQNSKHNKP